MLKPAAVTENDDAPTDIIFNAPEGDVKYYNESYEGWVYWGEMFGMQYTSGTSTNKIVWCDNNEVYIQNPVGNYPTSSYAKGTYADGKIKVELPQCIGTYYDSDGVLQNLYLNKMEEVVQDGEKYYMICYPEDNYLEYSTDEAGNVSLDLGNDGEYDVTTGNNPPYLVGITYGNEPHALQVWSGYGDTSQKWSYVDISNPVCPPESAKREEWAFETHGQKSVLEVAVDGNDIYVSGFTSYIKDYWFKGTIEDGKIIFPTKQFMGKNEYDQFYYFMAAKIYIDETSEWNQYAPIDQITMVYNPETGVYTAQEGETFIVSTNSEKLSPMAMAENPSLWQQKPETLNAKPLNPVLSEFKQEAGICTIAWDIPNENINGAVLPGKDMYYNLYIDGELYTFTPEEYPLFTEETTDVPYELSDYYNIYVYKTLHTIYYKKRIDSTVGLQSFYVAEDGTTYASDLVTESTVSTGISNTESSRKAVKTEYINMSGIRTATPDKGLYIKKTLYSDGTSKTEKVLIK